MNWSEIKIIVENRPLYFYGRSEDWVHKAIAAVGPPISIIDRDTYYHHKEYYGCLVLPIEQTDFLPNAFILVTAADYGGILEILDDLGFAMGKDYALSPDFAGYSKLCEMRSLAATVLIASSDYNDQKRARSSMLGGGLYTLDIPSGQLTRHYRGSLRQIARSPNGFITVDYVTKQILEFTPNFQVLRTSDIALANACGVAYSPFSEEIVLSNPGQDLVEFYSYSDLNISHSTQLLNPYGKRLPGGHHVNDICIERQELLFSYFSCVGRWKQGILDGGVSALSLNELRSNESMCIPFPIISGLRKPHSPFVVDNEVYVVDSLRGDLKTFSNPCIGHFQGFLRGCDYNESFFVIGVSEDMYIAESPAPMTTLLNAGILLLFPHLNIGRFYPTYGLMNIHSLLVVK